MSWLAQIGLYANVSTERLQSSLLAYKLIWTDFELNLWFEFYDVS